MCSEYIMVHILDVPYHADCEYTYFVPNDYREEIELGSSVVVPFGNSNRKKNAVVVNCDLQEAPPSSNIKPISAVLSGYFKLNKEMIELCYFMKKRTLCTFGEAVRCVIPSALISKTTESFSKTDNIEREIPDYTRELYGYICDNPNITLDKIVKKFGDVHLAIAKLVRLGAIKKETSIEEKDKNKYEIRVSLALDREEAAQIADSRSNIKLRSKRHAEILRLLCEYNELSDKEIYQMCDAQKSHIDALLKKGLIKTKKIELLRDPYALLKTAKNKEELVLNVEQQRAYNTLKELYYHKEPRAALLYGVTGSGKTSVIKKMIDEVISDNKGVIILVPEISLTPQTVSVFCGYYGDRVAVIHSSLSQGERFDTFKRISNGEADIVIGTRSAIFAPLKSLGMIVIDEEQEHTYKSDTNPKYLAHDIARYRCAKSNALMLLASATPSLESYYKAMSGAYTLVKMGARYGEATLPDVIISDMRKERARGNMSMYGRKLVEYLSRTIQDSRQSILFLNRRGYHSTVSCQSCGKAIQCPRCSVAMTYHSYRKIDESLKEENASEVMQRSGVLRCHYCGYKTRIPEKCSECGENDFNYVGFGTQMATETLEGLFPDIKTLRLDADTTTSKTSYEEILGAFKDKKADALIGTQMVTKGHNFPLVTLVGVVLADTMLYTSDYRAAERTFSMLTQVIGRAGRSKDHGVAIIQTNSPNDQTINLASKQDYESFYENEIQIRKAYTFPPFCDIAVLTLSSPDEMSLNKIAESLVKRLEEDIRSVNEPAVAYGPFEAPIYRLHSRFRKRILIKCKLNDNMRNVFSKIYIDFTKRSDKNFLSIDFNPSNL
ncbi:MAG: primosomal protein N' [Clostridia bacterium]|nr:primosomal protein N' [Clostridia bacterium]